jgi:hypothetical protein
VNLSSVQTLLDRLPSHFNKSEDSNNYKLLSIVARQSEDNTALYRAIQRFWDVDQTEGIGLDRLGKDEGINRGSYDDETYRKMIKIQYIVNLSEGDIESINTILRAYMGDGFLNVEEGWNTSFKEPASIVFNVTKVKDFPFALINKIKPAGVGAIVSAKKVMESTLFFGGIISTRNKIQIRPATFKQPTIQQTKYYAGFISTRTKTIIHSEV